MENTESIKVKESSSSNKNKSKYVLEFITEKIFMISAFVAVISLLLIIGFVFYKGLMPFVTEDDAIINVGVSGPGVVKYALEQVRGEGFEVLCETIKRTAFKITRVGQLVAQEASRRLGVPFGIIDLSLAPTPAIGDSVAEILQEIGLEHPGAPGTTAALALLNDQVKKGGVMASSYVGGLSGAFIPVSEDQGMINAVEAGALTLETGGDDLCLFSRFGYDCYPRNYICCNYFGYYCR